MIHSEEHDIADQMYSYYDKKEKFGMFLGLLKQRGKSWGYRMLSEMKSYRRENKEKNYPIEFLMKS